MLTGRPYRRTIESGSTALFSSWSVTKIRAMMNSDPTTCRDLFENYFFHLFPFHSERSVNYPTSMRSPYTVTRYPKRQSSHWRFSSHLTVPLLHVEASCMSKLLGLPSLWVGISGPRNFLFWTDMGRIGKNQVGRNVFTAVSLVGLSGSISGRRRWLFPHGYLLHSHLGVVDHCSAMEAMNVLKSRAQMW
jgi:hypothetical protein